MMMNSLYFIFDVLLAIIWIGSCENIAPDVPSYADNIRNINSASCSSYDDNLSILLKDPYVLSSLLAIPAVISCDFSALSHLSYDDHDISSFIQTCEHELNHTISQLPPAINVVLSPIIQSVDVCTCYITSSAYHHTYMSSYPIMTSLTSYCETIISHHHRQLVHNHMQLDVMSVECSTKMKTFCKKHLSSYHENVECYFSHLANLQYLCDDNIMSGFLASIFPVCNKDLLSDTCIMTMKAPYDAYDIMNCLTRNYNIISPSCREAVEGLHSSNIPCAPEAMFYCQDQHDISEFFTCMSDIDDEDHISQSCLATIQGYNRCKYPDYDDDDTVLSYGGNMIDDDDDDGHHRMILDEVETKKSSICWAKVYIAADDDDDDHLPSSSPSIMPTSSIIHAPTASSYDNHDTDNDDDDFDPHTHDAAYDDDDSKSAGGAVTVPTSLVFGVTFLSITISVAIIYIIRSYWKKNRTGRGKYIRASTRDLDAHDDASSSTSEEIIQSRLMDVDSNSSSKGTSIAMRRLDSSYTGVYGYDNPFAPIGEKNIKPSSSSSSYVTLPEPISTVIEPDFNYDSDDDLMEKNNQYTPI